MRIVFMGTPEFAKITLAELIGAGHEIVAVYTQPPRPAGRGMARQPSPVHAFALQQGLEVRHPTSLKSEHEQSAFRALDASAAVVVAYGLLLPAAVLQAPREGCFNLHGSELPRWRGAAPIQRAIMAGDTHSAVMVMRMDEGLDTGPVCLAERIEIGAEMTAGELHDEMAIIGAGLMVRALAALERGSLTSTPQSAEGITYAAKISKAEARIDFRRPAHEVHNKIRGLSPYPGAWFEVEFGGKRERIKALKSRLAEGSGAPGEIVAAGQSLRIGCGDGVVELISVQRAGKKSCSAAEFLRGCKITLGMHLPTA